MSGTALAAEDLLAWVKETAAHWKRLLLANPQLMDVPCDIAGTKSVAELLRHLIAAEVRYAERLSGLEARDYSTIPFDTIEPLFAVHDEAVALYERLLASTEIDWNERIAFVTRTGRKLSASRRVILHHALLHAIRHYAQLAPIVRHAGVPTDWLMDYLFMDAQPA